MKLKGLGHFLKEHPFFQGLDERHIDLMAGCASNVQFPVGRMIFRQGEPANHFYVIREGRVAVEITSPTDGAVVIRTLQAGDVLGWSWLIPPHRWHFDARCLEDARMLALDGVCLRQKCEADHDLGYELLKRFSAMIVDRLQATSVQLLDVYAGA